MVKSWLHIALPLAIVLVCSQMSPPNPREVFGKSTYVKGHQSKRDDDGWDWIRIETEYDHSVYMLPVESKHILEALISGARDYFESTLKVRRLDTLQLKPQCEDHHPRNYMHSCDYACKKRCGPAEASAEAAYFAPCKCRGKPCLSVSAFGGFLHNVDFVLFVSAKDTRCAPNTLGYASHCEQDKKTHRPISGYVNICPQSFINMKENEVQEWRITIKHELMHAFVFSYALFRNFVGAGPSQEVVIPHVLERFTRVDWETRNGNISHDVYMMVTPRVREEARAYFNCSDLEGAEIESQGGAGTAFSHWEKRVLENEAMSGYSTQVFAVSRITLAAFEDSGWYKPNYDKAHNMTWGRGLGCNFAKQSCLSWMRSHPDDPYPFCTTYEHSRCSPDRRAKMRCNMVLDFNDVPSEYDYNLEGLYHDKRGYRIRGHGHVDVADFCPYYKIANEASKEGTDTRCTFSSNIHYNNYSLEVFSPTSRCYDLDGGVEVKDERGTVTWAHTVGCFETICQDSILYVKTQRSQFYPCFSEGQRIYIEKRLSGIGTVRMRIVCPPCSVVCGQQHCSPSSIVKQRVGDPTRTATYLKSAFLSVVLTLCFCLQSIGS